MASAGTKKTDKGKKEEEGEEEEERLFIESRWKYREENRRMDTIEVVKLDPSNVKVIKETWPLIGESLEENGVKIYMKIFEVSPKIQAIFQLDKYHVGELSSNELLHLHARRFMESIESAVKNIDDLEGSVKPIFINLGKHHVRFAGLNADYFRVFSGALMYVWRDGLGDHFTPEVRAAWSRLFDFLLQHLNFGFQLELQDRANKQT